MKTEQPPVIRLSDYGPPDYAVEKVDLTFDLSPRETIVTSVLEIRRAEGATGPLTLDGEDLDLRHIVLDSRPLTADDMTVTESGLTLLDPPAAFTLATKVAIAPVDNTRLEGLYQSNGIYCTQCEAEGFRRITYFPDRPDVMSVYKVTVRASKDDCPILLSNGNNVSKRDLEDGRHEAVWHDPFPKPSYLFALVAGNLQAFNDRFTTRSGRAVSLHIWVEPGNVPRAAYAMDALKRSMKWDEDRFDLEYDLDVFNIVAVSDFNMGAMENKSLNVFNAKYILADPETATDADYANIEAIVGHEYFHNWTGNRVTCRDWFQLSLKEGLTVFRDQEFSADMRSRAVKRIQDVRMLRARQFPEDAGPLAHPVRPDSYMEINNFYTATVYEKGAEVIRMLHALLGEPGFQAGMKLYFERHDGQAVTCDDFVAAMADATDTDLSAFKVWYSQAGTPEVTAKWATDAAAGVTTLVLAQRTEPTPGQTEKSPVPIPIALGLLGGDGATIPLRVDGKDLGPETVLMLNEERLEVAFETGAARDVTPSLNRGFSAPVIMKADYGPEARARLMAHDTDPFARWEAGQQYATALLLAMVGDLREGRALKPDGGFIAALGAMLGEDELDPAFRALAAALPSEDYLAEQMRPVAVDEIHEARTRLRRAIGAELRETFQWLHDGMSSEGPYDPGAEAAGRRSLRNAALAYLCAEDTTAAAALAMARFREADNMTDRMAALSVLSDMTDPCREEALDAFHARFKDDEQVMDKWLSVQATSARPDTLGRVRSLMDHPVFSLRKPNKVRALIGAFAMANPVRFHAADGSGYAFVADTLIDLDKLNPQVAARLLGAFGQWRRLPADRSRLMRGALERIAGTEGLSRDCTEIATKSLAG
jgi:aminopeptidase N